MRFVLVGVPVLLGLGWAVACSSTTSDSLPGSDAGAGSDAPVSTSDGGDAGIVSDAASDAPVVSDASCSSPAASKVGETCVGFGKGSPCDSVCGEYGYVCFNGGPPNIAGCREMRTSAIVGNTYCCPTLACVREPDQDTKCTNAARPKRYQCAAAADGGALIMPVTACEEDVASRSPGSNFYCCAN